MDDICKPLRKTLLTLALRFYPAMENLDLAFRKAKKTDCHKIAELSLIAGEGFPAYFWSQSAKDGQDILDVGAKNAASETENFSYRNIIVVENIASENIIGKNKGDIVAMLLAYRLPDADDAEDLDSVPELVRPLVELEQCVPGSFYINMIATLPESRNMGIGSALMNIANNLALEEGCDLLSIEVFEQNEEALRLYLKHGYEITESRPVIPHQCHPYDSNVLLLTRKVETSDTAVSGSL